MDIKDLEPRVAQVILIHNLKNSPFKYTFNQQHLKTLAKLLELTNLWINIVDYNRMTLSFISNQ